jgi:multiple sugar transport system ATP-binding protein
VFVAGFIGTPQMNLLEATLLDAAHSAEGGALARFHLLGENISAVVDPAATRGAAGSKVTLGVRPRSFELVSPNTVDALHALIDLIEPMGAEMLLHLVEHGTDLRCVVPHTLRVAVGERVGVRCKPGQLHVFDEQGVLVQ